MEDDHYVGTSLKLSLESFGFRVLWVKRSSQGLKVLDDMKTEHDFITVDGDGWQGCRVRALERYGHQKLIVYSASSELIEQLRQEGYCAYVKGAVNKEMKRTTYGLAQEVYKKISDAN